MIINIGNVDPQPTHETYLKDLSTANKNRPQFSATGFSYNNNSQTKNEFSSRRYRRGSQLMKANESVPVLSQEKNLLIEQNSLQYAPSEMKFGKKDLKNLATVESDEPYDQYLAISDQVSQDGVTTMVPAATSHIGRLDSALQNTNLTQSIFNQSAELKKEIGAYSKHMIASDSQMSL